ERYGEDLAAVIVEPVSGNMGVVPPQENFLKDLRKITEDYGTLLIFDEVMTGFRVDYHCAQGYFDITPALTTLAEVIGRGLPVGSFCVKRKIAENEAPPGPIYQAATLSGSPLAMAAGYETLSALHGDMYAEMNEKVDQLVAGYEGASKQYD